MNLGLRMRTNIHHYCLQICTLDKWWRLHREQTDTGGVRIHDPLQKSQKSQIKKRTKKILCLYVLHIED